MRRIALLAAALLAAVAAAFAPASAANADLTIQAVTHKSPFNCNKTFWANNWIDSPAHSPQNTIDWQTYGTDAINGETVRATAGGTATFYNAGSTSYGLWVQIVHSDGSRTRYAHLASMTGAVGTSKTVSQGTAIGTVGSTGGSTAPHLHYEQRNSSGTVVTPVVEGVQVPYGSKKAIKSTNACGSTNPYTPVEVCGSGYSVIDSQAVTGGRVYLLYNGGNGYNCVTTIKSSSIGTASAVSASLQAEGGAMTTDSGSFAYYAGPIRKSAADSCVKWGGSVGSSTYLSGFEHCG